MKFPRNRIDLLTEAERNAEANRCIFEKGVDIRTHCLTGVQTYAHPNLSDDPTAGDGTGAHQFNYNHNDYDLRLINEIGRASCRERVYMLVVNAFFNKKAGD